MITSPFRTASGGRASWRRRLLLLTAAMVVASASVVISTEAEADAAPSGRPLGVDVSVYQHPNGQPIDWRAVRRYGVRFALVKADEGPKAGGSYYTNSWFKKDWNGAIAAGIATGAYHYARPRLPLYTAQQDARHFVNTVGSGLGGAGMPPVLDLEESGGLSSANLGAWAQSFLSEVQRLTGRQPMIYTALWFWNSYMGATTKLSSYPLWIANYASTPGLMPGGWSGWNFWQYTGSGRVPGIPAEVDVNVSCGTGTYLAGWCSAQRYSTWATAYYNRKWQEAQQTSKAASAAGQAAKPVPTTTKPTTGSGTAASSSSSSKSGTASSSSKSSSSGSSKSSSSSTSKSSTSKSSTSKSSSSGTSSTSKTSKSSTSSR
jgi:GH25 family lysozyme M1 (1,4-beta-N-acetylmuramidase)